MPQTSLPSTAPRYAWWGRCTRLLLLAAVVTLLFCAIHHKWTPAQWAVPTDYDGDTLEILARLKAASEGDLKPLASQRVTRLGAPFAADWNEYPGSDAWTNHVIGQVARLTGLGVAANLALWLAHLSAALTFYGCARLLRHRAEWALAGALLFAFSYFSISRGLPHLWIVFTWQAPLALATCWLVAAGGQMLRRPGLRWLCVGTAVALGASNPYSLFLYLQLLAWALLAAWRRRDAAPNLRLGLTCLTAALAMFALTHLPLWLHARDEGGRPLLQRNYAGTEIYGLKPIELVLPPADHRSGLLATLGSRYVRWSDWRGETFSPYLGLIGAAGLAWLLFELALRLAARRGPRPGALSLQALWILLFSSIGGVNSILAFYFGLQVFRATNRYSIFLFALALFFLVARLSRLTHRWPAVARSALALALTGAGLWDQIPRGPSPEARAALAARLEADQTLATSLERELGASAMVYQLPMLEFPEGNPRHKVGAYDHFRPYLASDTLRFSYGSRKSRAIGRWQRDFEHLTPAELVAALEATGFAAILIDRAGYPDQANSLLAGLATAGRPEAISGSGSSHAIVRLQPAARPRLPLARSPTYGRGWHPRGSTRAPGEVVSPQAPANRVRTDGEPEAGRRWRPAAKRTFSVQRLEEVRGAHGPAVMKYHNPLSVPLHVRLGVWLSAPDRRNLVLHCNGEEVATLNLDGNPRRMEVALTLRPGMNRLDFLTDRPAVRVDERRWNLRAFAVHELIWEIGPLPAEDGGTGDPATRSRTGVSGR